ncbi:hypothetical protein PQX77_010005, partial [Marasmius sp. AFHP31]
VVLSPGYEFPPTQSRTPRLCGFTAIHYFRHCSPHFRITSYLPRLDSCPEITTLTLQPNSLLRLTSLVEQEPSNKLPGCTS